MSELVTSVDHVASDAMRYLGMGDAADAKTAEKVKTTAEKLIRAVRPRYVYKVCPIARTGDGISLVGTSTRLSGKTALTVLSDCTSAVLLVCTLGAGFDSMLRTEQARDMANAVVLDACGSALVEHGCDTAEAELSARLCGKFLTDRFSPGYGDLPLALQREICTSVDSEKRLGVYVTESCLLNPMKSVAAIIGISDTVQPARIRGCAYCNMKENCPLRKGGKNCEL